MINPNFVVVGVLIASFGSFGYLLATIRGEVKPNKVSFFLWSLAPLIAFVASFVKKNAAWELHAFDFVCGGLSVLGLILWYITRSGDIAIICSILADGLAALPTVVKAFNHPETEIGWTYFLSTMSAAITLLTIKVWDLAHAGFPLYILLITLVISTLVQFKLGERMKAQFKIRKYHL